MSEKSIDLLRRSKKDGDLAACRSLWL